MRRAGMAWVLGVATAWTAAAAELVPSGAPAQAGLLAEFTIIGVPAAANPTDPDQVAVDVSYVSPDGARGTVPGFWFRNYRRALVNGTEVLTPTGRDEWRLRYRPWVAGIHTLTLTVTTNGQPAGTPFAYALEVLPNPQPVPGRVGLAPNRRHLERDGKPFPLVGQCVCWPGGRGTFDYDTWFGSMAQAGENYARLWMAPWAFGIEAEAGTLTRYRMDRAWQLDQVFALAERQGMILLLCLDFHGMFEVTPDYWGGNNFWPQNPYNIAQGGPCSDQKAFFSSPEARRIYQKRLRYLVARYGHSPALLAWQFFNEIDNVYGYLDAAAVADWHATMAAWLRNADPSRHLITTSLTGGSDRPEIWSIPGLDFAVFHSYGQPDPAVGLAAKVSSMHARYQKPVMIGEFGVNWQGWKPEDDPYGRALRQGIWAGLMGGALGTSMPWYWEAMHEANYYPFFHVVADFTRNTHLGRGSWNPLASRQAPPPPDTVDDLVPGGAPFTATLVLNPGWGLKPSGALAVANPDSALEASGALAAFVHGTAHPDLRVPFRLSAWFDARARIVLHVNSVSDGARASVWVDGVRTWEQSLPNLDGTWQVNQEYNADYAVALPAGRHLVEVRNTGGDWFYLDWVRLEEVLPSRYTGGWSPEPVVAGMGGDSEAVVYVAVPQLRHPARVQQASLELQAGLRVAISNQAPGVYSARWFDARGGAPAGTTEAEVPANGNLLILPLPDFREDLVGRILRKPRLRLTREPDAFEPVLTVEGARGLDVRLEVSPDLHEWRDAASFTNAPGSLKWLLLPSPVPQPRLFRAAAN